jgi:hypothetical protein
MTTPATTKPKPTAATIRQINDAHDAVVNAARDALQKAMRAGELLVAVKDGQEHGDWKTWLTNNCPKISDRTARLYMSLSKNEDKLIAAAEKNGNAVADLSVREAQKLLAQPLTTEQKAEREKARNETKKNQQEQDRSEWIKSLNPTSLCDLLVGLWEPNNLSALAEQIKKKLPPPASPTTTTKTTFSMPGFERRVG